MKAQISLIKFNCVKILLSSVTILLVVVVLLTQANPSTSLIQQQHHLSHHQLQPQQQSAAASSSSASSILHHQQQQQQQHQHHNQQAVGKGIFKRSFAGLGCLGVYDKAKFARLDRVCEECYQLYREPDIHTACRQDCFRNGIFTRCVDALLLSHEQKKFDEMVEELYGK